MKLSTVAALVVLIAAVVFALWITSPLYLYQENEMVNEPDTLNPNWKVINYFQSDTVADEHSLMKVTQPFEVTSEKALLVYNITGTVFSKDFKLELYNVNDSSFVNSSYDVKNFEPTEKGSLYFEGPGLFYIKMIALQTVEYTVYGWEGE